MKNWASSGLALPSKAQAIPSADAAHASPNFFCAKLPRLTAAKYRLPDTVGLSVTKRATPPPKPPVVPQLRGGTEGAKASTGSVRALIVWTPEGPRLKVYNDSPRFN